MRHRRLGPEGGVDHRPVRSGSPAAPSRLGRAVIWLSAILIGIPSGLMLLYRVFPPPATPLMLIRMLEGEAWHYEWQPLRQISPLLSRAVMASEDERFCSHHGFDWVELHKAVDDARAGERLRGASTISMQTARNLFLWPGRDFVRKGIEAYLTVLLEALLPKARIMELYLNIAEWGRGIYGAQAAAETHFHQSAATLTRQEAAQLAAVLPNPREMSAGHPSPYVEERAETIARQMEALPPPTCLNRR